jgi:asparagine synthase (glutamine-hydrolysing)
MCGIAGEWWGRRPSPHDRGVAAMLARLQHRGPDGHGLHSGPEATIGMTRLAVMDVFGHAPPYLSEDGQIGVVFNGELYNVAELRRDLIRRGHRLAGDADGDLLPHLYEEWGPDMLPRLVGMFALAVYDRRRHALLVARDRLGIKPLYLWRQRQHLRFASEMKAFFAYPDFLPTVREDLLPTLLRFRFVPAPETFVAGVEKLPPGHLLEVSLGFGPTIRPWWRLEAVSDPPGSLAEAAEELQSLWRRIVRDHVAADRPRGIFLSGGVDSGWLAAGLGSENAALTAVTLDGTGLGPAYDEAQQAERVATRWGWPVHRVPMRVPEVDDLVRIAGILDEPLGDPTVLTFDLVADAARREGLTVVFSGEGADEVFAGYPHYREAAVLDRLEAVARAVDHVPLLRRWLYSGRFGARRLETALQPTARYYGGVGMAFIGQDLPRHPALEAYWDHVRTKSRLKRMLGFDLLWFLGDDALPKCDRIGMHYQLEVRVPYLDHRLVEWAWSLPDAFLVDRGRQKRVLRQAAGAVDPDLAVQPKRSFPTPVTAWLRGPLNKAARDILDGPDVLGREHVAGLWRDLEAGSPHAGRRLYLLLMTELWRQWLRAERARATEEARYSVARAAD